MERITRHDLKTPLNAVINIPHLLIADESDPEKIELIKNIQDAGYRMLGLVNRSYDIYRMETDSYILDPEKVDVLPLIRRIAIDLQDMLESRGSEFRVFIDDSEVDEHASFFVRGEDLLLFSMLSNLLKNAIEATPDGKPITVELSSGEFPRVSIHNFGEVPASVRESFFEKYSTAGKNGGTGLGTYSASLIAKVHGGSICMESCREGTTVVVDFNPASAREETGSLKVNFDPLPGVDSILKLPLWFSVIMK